MSFSFPHTVAVSRFSHSVASGQETHSLAAVAGLGAVPCLVETMSARQQQNILGAISQKIYRISWGTEDLRDGDRITWKTRSFILQYDADDQHRVGTGIPPYQTGILREEAVTRA